MAGMPGGDPLPCSPPRLLGHRGSTRLSAPLAAIPGACTSQRRFARPRGCALSSTSAGGHRSPPAASVHFRNLPPARSDRRSRPRSAFAIALAGPIFAAFPLPDADPEPPDRLSTSTLPRGFHPSASSCLPRPARVAHLDPRLDFRSLPAAGFFLSSPLRIIVPGSLPLARLAVPSDLLEPFK